MAQIEWAIIDGEQKHISTLKPDARPSLTICLCCGEQLIPKLGVINEWHFAHRADASCALTNPETALHFNKKWEWATKIKKDRNFVVRVSCNSCSESYHEFDVIPSIDDTQVEYRIGNYIADVAMFLDGHLQGVIEVVVTHKMEPAKEQFFRSEYIQFYEMDARDHDRLLNSNPAVVGKYTCDRCLKLQAEREKMKEMAREQEKRNRKLTFHDIFTTQFIQVNQRTLDAYAGSDWQIPTQYRDMFQLDKPIKAVVNDKLPDGVAVLVAFGKVVKLRISEPMDGNDMRKAVSQ